MGVWCCYDMARKSGSTALAPETALAKWLAGGDAEDVQKALLAPDVAKSPDARLLKDLTDPKGPFLGAARKEETVLPGDTRESLSKMRAELAELKKTLPAAIATCHGVQEGGCPQTAWAGFHDAPIHIRGRYDACAGSRRCWRRRPAARRKGSGRLGSPAGSRPPPSSDREGHQPDWGPLRGRDRPTASNYGKLGTLPSHPELPTGSRGVRPHRLVDQGDAPADHAPRRTASRRSPIRRLRRRSGNQLFGRMNRRRLTAKRATACSRRPTGSTHDEGPRLDIASGRRTLYLTTVLRPVDLPDALTPPTRTRS
jgi:hypothetical protein